jgi:hypothetical protein
MDGERTETMNFDDGFDYDPEGDEYTSWRATAMKHEKPADARKGCYNCRFWSERLAQSNGGAAIEAYCLGKDGPLYGKYTTGNQACMKWASNYNGAVDDPVHDGKDAYRGESAEERDSVP